MRRHSCYPKDIPWYSPFSNMFFSFSLETVVWISESLLDIQPQERGWCVLCVGRLEVSRSLCSLQLASTNVKRGTGGERATPPFPFSRLTQKHVLGSLPAFPVGFSPRYHGNNLLIQCSQYWLPSFLVSRFHSTSSFLRLLPK